MDRPHAVLSLMPDVTDRLADVPADSLRSRPDDSLAGPNGPARRSRLRPDDRLWADVSLTDSESPAETEPPTVLVYESPAVSVTVSPTVSVSWLITNRCSVPICSLAALASSALPSRMNATAAFPRPSRCRTGPGIVR